MSEVLINFKKELEEELFSNILPWWMKHAPDKDLGGFYGHIDHNNKVVEGAPKGAVLHARMLWTFAAAYRISGHKAHLEVAKKALAYIREHFLDSSFGGVFWELEADGSVRSDRKQIYAIAFTIHGLAEYHMATGDESALEDAKFLFHDLETNALDREKGGYTDALSREWLPMEVMRISDKDQDESKTMNTHLHILGAYSNLSRCWGNPVLEKALEDLLLLMGESFTNRENGHLNLFFNEDWELKSSFISYGHDIEASWLMYKAAEVLDRPELLEEFGKLAIHMARANREGLGEDGGLAYEYIPESGEWDRDRHWWTQAEALVGHFNAWELSGDKLFLEQSLLSWSYIKNRLIDNEYGEWIWSVAEDGSPQKENEKAGFWKCPYHNARACMEVMHRINKQLDSYEK